MARTPRKLRRVLTCLITLNLLILMMPIKAWAWGDEGHKITALIAFALLNPRAQQNVLAVLGGEEITEVATWPDALKRAGEGCVVPRAGCNPNYRPETVMWHFVDMPITGDGRFSRNGDYCRPSRYGDCIVPAIEDFKVILNRGTSRTFARYSDEQKRKFHDALSFMVHFLGDIHQPLHCADKKDGGGNNTLVTWQNEPKYPYDDIWNLHSLWDEYLVTLNIMKMEPANRTYEKYAESLLNALSPKERDYAKLKSSTIDASNPENVIAWAESSHALARKSAYNLPPKTVTKSFRGFQKLDRDKLVDIVVLDEQYFSATMTNVERQLRLGGVRLARLLNEIYDKDIH